MMSPNEFFILVLAWLGAFAFVAMAVWAKVKLSRRLASRASGGKVEKHRYYRG